MSKLSDVMAYVCQRYPHKDELSKARLAKIIYLADWRAAIERGEQITDVQWKFNHYGPYVDDILETAERDNKRFKVVNTLNMYGNPKDVIKLKEASGKTELSAQDKEDINFIIEKTRRLYWKDFINLVYSTYPVLSQEKQTVLDLPKLAKAYSHSQNTAWKY